MRRGRASAEASAGTQRWGNMGHTVVESVGAGSGDEARGGRVRSGGGGMRRGRNRPIWWRRCGNHSGVGDGAVAWPNLFYYTCPSVVYLQHLVPQIDGVVYLEIFFLQIRHLLEQDFGPKSSPGLLYNTYWRCSYVAQSACMSSVADLMVTSITSQAGTSTRLAQSFRYGMRLCFA